MLGKNSKCQDGRQKFQVSRKEVDRYKARIDGNETSTKGSKVGIENKDQCWPQAGVKISSKRRMPN